MLVVDMGSSFMVFACYVGGVLLCPFACLWRENDSFGVLFM